MKLVNRIFRVGRNAEIRDELTEGTAILNAMNEDAIVLRERIHQLIEAEERRIYARRAK